jgi:hypothetical protein
MPAHRALSSLALAAAILAGAVAAASPADAQNASFCGVVSVRGHCMLVSGSVGSTGRTFDISTASPRPRRNATISGSGLVRGISGCVGATGRLAHVTWRRVSVCPLAR